MAKLKGPERSPRSGTDLATGVAASDSQETNPFSDEATLQARLREALEGQKSSPLPDSQATNPFSEATLQARLREAQAETGGRGLHAVRSNSPREPLSDSLAVEDVRRERGGAPPPESGTYEPNNDTSLHARLQRELSLHDLVLPVDPGIRVIVKHPKGNSHIEFTSVQGARLVLTPKESEDHGPPLIQAWGASQNKSGAVCGLKIKDMGCHLELIYIRDSDDIILVNQGNMPVSLNSSPASTAAERTMRAWDDCRIQPGFWWLQKSVELQLRPRGYLLRHGQEASSKRLAPGDEASPKKMRGHASATARQSSRRTSNQDAVCHTDGLGLQRKNHTVEVIDLATGEVEYTLKRTSDWQSDTRSSQALPADLVEGSCITHVLVKVVGPEPNSRSDDYRHVQSAKAWLKEFRAHRYLQHPRIASLVGHDARILSLFVAYIPAQNLEQWRYADYYFSGDTSDATIILKHTSSAIAYLDQMHLAHNDIKPANILYTRHEAPATGPYPKVPPGAVLVDFGLAEDSGRRVGVGGSPWYIAPEYMDRGLRGTPGDVFALGVVMLYAMRCFMLPEKQVRSWLIREIPEKNPQALETMRDRLDKVARARRTLVEGVSEQSEAKLRTLVHRMLDAVDSRITAADLDDAASQWEG